MPTRHKNIEIQPCKTDWNAMEAQQDGNRFCHNCSKVVFDMAEMTEKEAETFLKANPGSCGNFYAGQVESLDRSDLKGGQAKQGSRNSNWKKAIATAAALAMLHGQIPAEGNTSESRVPATNNQAISPTPSDEKRGPSTNTLVSGIVVDQNDRMVTVPMFLKIYLGSELIAYPVEVNHGLFSVDLKGKAISSDRITIVVFHQSVQGWKFAKTKTRTLVGEAQNLTVKSEVISRPPIRRGGGRMIYLNEI